MRKATLKDTPLVTKILSQAFDDNKSVNYVVKQDKLRQKRIQGLMEYSFNMCHKFGDVWISDDQEACALILHPDQKRFSLSSTFWDIRLALSVIGPTRITKVLKRESEIKQNHPPDPFSYLWFIGVNPSIQAQGIGSKLLSEVIDACEKKIRPIYLETSVDRNLSWYEKFGFEIFNSLDLSYKLYLLRRNLK